MNTIAVNMDEVSTISVKGIKREIGVPFICEGKKTVITKSVGRELGETFRVASRRGVAILADYQTISEGNGRIVRIGISRGVKVIKNDLYRHPNGVQYIAIVTSQK
jgi:hypothetical protein